MAEIASKLRGDQDKLQEKAAEQPAENAKSLKALTTNIGNRVAALLTPRQSAALADIRFRETAPFYLQNADLLIKDKVD